MHPTRGIILKVLSLATFAAMSALVRRLGEGGVPLAEVVFFRSLFAIVPVVVIYTVRGELAAAVTTRRPLGHLGRGTIGVVGMFLNFAALARLPLVDATLIGFAAPSITVVLAALLLKEKVRSERWVAVAIGFVGVVVMLWPYLDGSRFVGAATSQSTIGAACAIGSAFTMAGAQIQVRRLTGSETTSSIVLYFSLITTLASAVVLPFVWRTPTTPELVALVATGVLGGVSHLLLTESFRFAPASVLAPFDYLVLLFALALGYVFFGEVPTAHVYAGAAIVIAAGLAVMLRERRAAAKRRE